LGWGGGFVFFLFWGGGGGFFGEGSRPGGKNMGGGVERGRNRKERVGQHKKQRGKAKDEDYSLTLKEKGRILLLYSLPLTPLTLGTKDTGRRPQSVVAKQNGGGGRNTESKRDKLKKKKNSWKRIV